MRCWNRKYFRLILAVTIGAFSTSQMTGCAAGNYGLVRTIANWNLKFSIIPRVLIYLLFIIIPVYQIGMLFDILIDNTVEFWTGSPLVHAKNETFKKNGYLVSVTHTRDPLRKTVLTAYDKMGKI